MTTQGIAMADKSPRGMRVRGLLRALTRERMAVFAGGFLLIILATALFAPLVATHDPATQSLFERYAPWSGDHWLGTDDYGRDVFSRLVFGARATMMAAAIAVGVSLIVGVPAGLIAGYRPGPLDAMLSRLFDALMSIPGLMLALTIVAVLGPGLVNAMAAVGLVFAPQFFRVTRASTREVMGETFVEAAISIGCAPQRVLAKHVLPNVVPPVIVQISVALGVAVSAEASLSFLGLGVEAPTASWGSMLSTSAQTMTLAPNLVWIPGLLIFSVVLAFTMLGEGLRRFLGRTNSRSSND